MGLIEERWPNFSRRQKIELLRGLEYLVLICILLIAFILITFKFTEIGIYLIIFSLIILILLEFSRTTNASNRTSIEEIIKYSDQFEKNLNVVIDDLNDENKNLSLTDTIIELHNTARAEGLNVWKELFRAAIGFLFLISLLTLLLYAFEAKYEPLFPSYTPSGFGAHIYVVLIIMFSFGGGSLTLVNHSGAEMFALTVIFSGFLYLIIFFGVIINNIRSGSDRYFTAIRQFVWDHAADAGYLTRFPPTNEIEEES